MGQTEERRMGDMEERTEGCWGQWWSIQRNGSKEKTHGTLSAYPTVIGVCLVLSVCRCLGHWPQSEVTSLPVSLGLNLMVVTLAKFLQSQ